MSNQNQEFQSQNLQGQVHSLINTYQGILYCELCMKLWAEIQKSGNMKCGGASGGR